MLSGIAVSVPLLPVGSRLFLPHTHFPTRSPFFKPAHTCVMVWLNRLIAGLTVLSGAEHVAAAFPRGTEQPGGDVAVDFGIPHPFSDYPPVIKARQEDGPELRILPLGASIMSGVGSPEHSGSVQAVRIFPGMLTDSEH